MPKKKHLRADQRYEIKRTIPNQFTIDGKKVRKSFYSYISIADCEKQYEEYLINMNSGITVVSPNITVGEWAIQWLEIYKKGNVKDSTYQSSYERPVNNQIIPCIGNRILSTVRSTDINSFMSDLQKKYSQSTIDKVKNCLFDMFDRAGDNDLIIKNPCKKIQTRSDKEKAEKRTYPEETVKSILKYASTVPDGIYIKILLILGLRCSELCGLKYSDFDFENKTVNISRAATDSNGKVVVDIPKSKNSVRTLPLSDSFAEELKQSLKESKTGFILPSPRRIDKPVNPKNFVKRYNKFFAGYVSHINDPSFEQLSPHELRHTCGTLLYKKTKDIYAVSRYMGHSSIEVTAKYYIHSDAETLRKLAVF